ncbi:MAG: WecB/TagA/CpsF family glycosyltransferase [Lachnospiraceae bacterium]|nr:WecB/TagA/CpsF family glycosyltransferase [Lachnospiraceae bacterium]
MAELQYCEILKTNINVTNMRDTLAYIDSHLEELRGSYICVSNVHTTVMSYENADYRTIQNSAAMALPDGAPLSHYSRSAGFKTAERVTGPDLMVELFRRSGEKGYRHFFYGSTQKTLDDMHTALQREYPEMVIAGMYSPPFRPLTEEEDKGVIARINDANADFIWVGLGAPKQEAWMYEHRGKLNAVAVGVGAGFDYVAGNIKRAPRLMQVLCLEWLYRLMQDPRRLWKRYVTTNVKFMRYLLREKRNQGSYDK